MDTGQIITSLLIAVVLTLIFVSVFKSAGPWKGYWPYFLIFLFVALAAARWITPVGPTIFGYSWIPGLAAALIVAILIWTVTPSTKRTKRKNNFYNPDPSQPPESSHQKDEYVESVVIGTSFWFLILLLITIIGIGIIL